MSYHFRPTFSGMVSRTKLLLHGFCYNNNNNNNNNNNTLFILINVNVDTMNRRYQRLFLSTVSPFKSKQFKSTQLNLTQHKSNQIIC